MTSRNANPSLKTALDKRFKAMATEDFHGTSDGNMAQCPHNAHALVTALADIFFDAGYMVVGIMLGTIVQSVIDTASIDGCEKCAAESNHEVA